MDTALHKYELILSESTRNALLNVLDYAGQDQRKLTDYAQGVAHAVAAEIRQQIPKPLPTKLAAVVQTKDDRVWVYTDTLRSPGWCHADPDDAGLIWWTTDALRELGIARVISEGVDL